MSATKKVKRPVWPAARRLQRPTSRRRSRTAVTSAMGPRVASAVCCVAMARKSIPQAFTRKLLAWYARAARDLPWRRTRDPYRVAVSEFMLQQTQVARVLEIQSGDDGVGGADLRGEEAEVRRVPGATPLQDGETIS